MLVDDDPAEKVLAAIGMGASRASQIAKVTGQSSATVYRHLKRLREQGAVTHDGRDYAIAETSHERV
jgi:DNA-binding IclR family transcriptional regulator